MCFSSISFKIVLCICVVLFCVNIAVSQQNTLQDIKSKIAEISESYGLDSLLGFSIVHEESSFNPDAVNEISGCKGLWQLNPKFFKLENYFDIEQNTNWGVWYFMYLLEKFNNDTLKALTGYVYGPYHAKTKEYGTCIYAIRVLKHYYDLCVARGLRILAPKCACLNDFYNSE